MLEYCIATLFGTSMAMLSAGQLDVGPIELNGEFPFLLVLSSHPKLEKINQVLARLS